jgi:hypothetical protein
MPGGQTAIRALSWIQTREIVDAFETLNPYSSPSGPASILEAESENYDPETGQQRQIECYAIASKRYCIFIGDPGDRPVIVGTAAKRKRSEHGLGHLIPPAQPNGDWIDTWWQHLLCIELGFETPEPPWFTAPAVGRLTVTSTHDLRAFKTYNAGRPYDHAWEASCRT